MKISNFHFAVCRLLLVGILVGMIVFVEAVAWNSTSYASPYYFSEDTFSPHNFTANLSDASDLSYFLILDIVWTEGSIGASHSGYYWLPWNDSVFSNSSTGVLDVGAGWDNETGNFTLNVHAQGTGGVSNYFNFIINATNDAPNFTNLNSSLIYEFPQNENGSYTINALDEEAHYPLNFNLTFFNNCTHASWSGRADGENCSIFNLSGATNTSTIFDFDPMQNDVGTYWANFSVTDFNGTCPHAYCDASSYEVNKSSEVYVLQFNVYSTLSVNVSNCTGATVTEGETFNCTINVTTRGETDELDFSSYGFFSSNPAMSYNSSNRDWFYANATYNASNFSYSLPVSVSPVKNEVGNWTINFSVSDGSTSELGQIEIFVNFSEANVSLGSISNVTLYENFSFEVNASDDDLLIWDSSVKNESLSFGSDTPWVSVTSPSVSSHSVNYSTSTVSIDYDSALNNFGENNYTVNVSVSDLAGNLDSRTFVVEILNETAPIWNTILSNPVVLNLTEDESFVYNVSVNVSDPGETVSFYYNNVSEEFCSLSVSSFNSSGMISFMPTDCDVGLYNVSIIASNGKLNSSRTFLFNVSNVADAPSINALTGDNGTNQTNLGEGVSFIAPEGVAANFSLVLDDDDLLIPEGQRNLYYNESFVVDVVFTNSTDSEVDFFNFSFVEYGNPYNNSISYNATFTPGVGDAGNYSVFVNVTDASGNSTNRTWFLNVTESLDAPVLEEINNVTTTIHDYLSFSLNASDDEDDNDGLNLSYSISRLDSSAPNLTVTADVVSFNMSSNVSYAGSWGYNVTVNDSDGMIDSQVFWISIYGVASLVSPVENSSFNLTENVSGVLNFTINHSMGDNLTYEFWVDNMSCVFQNNSNCSYGNLSLRELTSSFGNGSIFGWSFQPNFSDESYGNLKNLTVSVYPNSSSLNLSQRMSVVTNFSFGLNVSHTNAPVVRGVLSMQNSQANNDQNISYDLSSYFSDVDVDDTYYSQNLSLSVVSDRVSNIDANGVRVPTNVSQNNWSLVFTTGFTTAEFLEIVNVTVSDVNESTNTTITSAASNNFQLTFTVPTTTTTTVPTPSGGSSGSSTKLKFYSLRIIVPDDVIISDEDYIEIPFGLENTGTIDLKGITLSGTVLYNNEFSDDVKIELGETYIAELRSGEVKEYSMKILADTDRSGRYRATITANISSPVFSDWADFFIDLRRTNESEITEMLIFTEKIIADNPECLELTEVFRRAEEAFELGNMDEAMRLAVEVSEACEDAIKANEQIRYKVEGFVENNFYYIAFATLAIFFIGFIFYVYKRVRFNNSVGDGYV